MKIKSNHILRMNTDPSSSNIESPTEVPLETENTSNVIVMTPEMTFMKSQIQKNNELQNIISRQSSEIGRLVSEVELWKGKYEEIFSKIL